MNDLGILKRIDNLGRIVIPKDMRSRYNLTSEVELVMTKSGILIKNPEGKSLDNKKKS